MKSLNLTNTKEIELLERVNDVFVKYGMKKVTMDDMAKHLNVSKKTLYKYVKNRKELVLKSTIFHIQREEQRIHTIQALKLDPIAEHHELAKFVVQTMTNMNPQVHHDLEHHFQDSWEVLSDYFNDFVFKSILENLERGQKEGYYHNEFSAEIIARFFASRVDIIFDGEFFPKNKFGFKEVYLQYLMYHLNSITTEKGKQIINQLDFKHL